MPGVCAQRRPGHQPPDPRRGGSHLSQRRSTKAGASTPATPASLTTTVRLSASALNEGRGINPGDTRRIRSSLRAWQPRSTKAGASTPATRESSRQRPSRTAHPLNEGRRINPGDTHERSRARRRADARSTKAGASTPATPRLPRARLLTTSKSLNEGRASTPATPANLMYHWSTDGRAQRRPGHQPRRHSRSLAAREEARQRSTKAGASTPATPLFIFSECFATRDAQRRPGHQPRRHAATRVVQIVGIPAQRRPGLQPRRHSNVARYEYYDHGRAQRRPGHQPRRHVSLDLRPICLAARSTKAGASTPATPPRPRRGAQRLSALNEGRGINPGDTSGRCVSACRIRGRSTKARGINPGDTGAATLA